MTSNYLILKQKNSGFYYNDEMFDKYYKHIGEFKLSHGFATGNYFGLFASLSLISLYSCFSLSFSRTYLLI